VSDTADTPPAAAHCAITHFLSAVHQALDLPAPRRRKDQVRYLKLLDQRTRLARASIGRLIGNPHTDALDYTSEGDHLRHALADLPPDTYRHDPAGQLLPDACRHHRTQNPPAWTAAAASAIEPGTVRMGVLLVVGHV
jgi:hypothetical protein